VLLAARREFTLEKSPRRHERRGKEGGTTDAQGTAQESSLTSSRSTGMTLPHIHDVLIK